ncbi:phosphotransferase family protein [Mycobacterium vicinigordonae]|uniref:Phosphotransferase family protein n=1 Tax=Mycobacterium vicinigordonae TaxID=1719132 RepID=A0A7D6E440_9MYCO|nr:phosphotransferase family protein [Mycobacterium vicinigordonae]QLL06363.1 phosphotransferase family protein [Mycobacterium vicinigordonae]
MALVNTLDPQGAARSLQRWLGKVGVANPTVTGVEVPPAAGFSMTTALFHADWDAGDQRCAADLVARIAPTGEGLFEQPDLAREVKILRALAGQPGVTVPAVRWFEADPATFGSPFVVMDRAFGVVPSDDPPYPLQGWVVGLEPSQRANLFTATLRAVAAIHAVDWETCGLSDLSEPGCEPGIRGEWAKVERAYAWAHRGNPSPTIDAAIDILRDRLPENEPIVLNWGDARLGNVIFDPQTVEIRALLDWEMATLASPEMDLGWFLFFVRYYTEGIGADPLPGFQGRDELIGLYEQFSGHEVRNIDFYEAFAALRTSVVLLRIGRLMIDAGVVPPDSPMPLNNIGSQILARLLGLAAPAGDVANFVDTR